MSQIEQIKAEIEQQLKDSKKRLGNIEKAGMTAPNEEQLQIHLKGILAKLDTLQEQPVEWSEKDETKLNDVIRIIEGCGLVESIRNHYINFLKSLRPQSGQEQPVNIEKELERWKRQDSIYANDIDDCARHFYELGRQSKQTEWTEKDIENGSYISAFLQANCGGNATLKEATVWFMSRLKQLPMQQSKPEMSEELEEEIKRWLKEGDITDAHYDDYDDNDIEVTARHFAKWQMGKDLSSINKSYESGVVFGMNAQKEQMIKGAIDVTLNYTHQITLEGGEGFGKKGEHIKFIIVKGD